MITVEVQKGYEMSEPQNNIRIAHAKCFDERKNVWQEKNKDLVIQSGDIIKKGFIDTHGKKEHMWVKITKVIDQTIFLGVLDNEPIFCSQIKLGSECLIKREEIEEYLPRK